MKVLCLFALIIAAANASSYNLYYGSYIELNDASFNQATLDFPLLLVKFYHPGCHWCDSFASSYIQIGKQIRAANINVMPAEINVMQNAAVRTQQNIVRHPTVKLWVRATKQWYTFSGTLNTKSVVQWAENIVANIKK